MHLRGTRPYVAAAVTSAGAAGATLDYTPPGGNPGPHVHKTVVGATYQRLAALIPVPAGNATCNVLNGESATITVAHDRRDLRAGSPAWRELRPASCRGSRDRPDEVVVPDR